MRENHATAKDLEDYMLCDAPPAPTRDEQPRPRPQADMMPHRPQQGVPAQMPARPQQVAMDENGEWQMRNEAEELAVINRLRAAKAIPATYQTAEQVAYAIQILKRRGLDPMVCIGDTGFVNGKYIMYNDVPLAIAQQTGQLEHIEEFTYAIEPDGTYKRRCYENANLHKRPDGAVCVIKRRGHEKVEFSWTKEEAQDSGQLNKPGPWKTDFAGMLKYKARARALRSQFAWALAGGNGKNDDIDIG